MRDFKSLVFVSSGIVLKPRFHRIQYISVGKVRTISTNICVFAIRSGWGWNARKKKKGYFVSSCMKKKKKCLELQGLSNDMPHDHPLLTFKNFELALNPSFRAGADIIPLDCNFRFSNTDVLRSCTGMKRLCNRMLRVGGPPCNLMQCNFVQAYEKVEKFTRGYILN